MISSRKLSDLLPRVEIRAEQFVARCATAGIDVLVTSTFRDFEAQHELWRIGRELPGEPCSCGGVKLPIGSCPIHPMGRVVTNADAGESYHNYRCALDFVPIINGKPVWNDEKLFTQCGEIAESIGFEWAGRWKRFRELPHIQITGGLTIAQLKNNKLVA